jgi:hypothetical protein
MIRVIISGMLFLGYNLYADCPQPEEVMKAIVLVKSMTDPKKDDNAATEKFARILATKGIKIWGVVSVSDTYLAFAKRREIESLGDMVVTSGQKQGSSRLCAYFIPSVNHERGGVVYDFITAFLFEDE